MGCMQRDEVKGKNGHMWMNEYTERVCENMIKTINHHNKEHTLTHLSFRNSFVHQNSLRFDIGLLPQQSHRITLVSWCVVFTVFFQSDRKPVVSIQFETKTDSAHFFAEENISLD